MAVSYHGSNGTQAGFAGYLEVGFVDATHGFAIPAGGSQHEIDLTTGGGQAWSPTTFAG